jgi:hypothetical protein
MDVTILTLRYSATRKGIDDAPLREALEGRSLLSFREHLFEMHGVPHLACVVVTEPHPETADHAPPAEEPMSHRLPPTPRSGPDPGRRRSAAQSRVAQELDPEKRPAFERLRRWRLARARDEGVPPYVILTNRQLLDILRVGPTSGGALARIDGLGKAKVERYGRDILRWLHDGDANGRGENERGEQATTRGPDAAETSSPEARPPKERNAPRAAEAEPPPDDPVPSGTPPDGAASSPPGHDATATVP